MNAARQCRTCPFQLRSPEQHAHAMPNAARPKKKGQDEDLHGVPVQPARNRRNSRVGRSTRPLLVLITKKAAICLRSASPDPSSGPSTIKAVDHASACSAVGATHRNRRKLMIDRGSSARVDNVRVAKSSGVKEVAIIAGGRHRTISQIDHPMDGSRPDHWLFDPYPPGCLVRRAAVRPHITADIDQKMVHTGPCQVVCNLVDGKALANTGQINCQVGTALSDRRRSIFDTQVMVADLEKRCFDALCRRVNARLASRDRSPKG